MAKTTAGRQTSNKSGVQSTSKKLDNSRHGFDTYPNVRNKDGAFGEEEGRKAEPPRPGTASPRGKGGALEKMKNRRTEGR
jgi:hypothetical protein